MSCIYNIYYGVVPKVVKARNMKAMVEKYLKMLFNHNAKFIYIYTRTSDPLVKVNST